MQIAYSLDREDYISGLKAVVESVSATEDHARFNGRLETLTTARYTVLLLATLGLAAAYPAATLPVTLVMLEAIRDYFFATGIRIGMKPAGGIRTSKEALAYLVMVKETLGEDWLTPDLFRFGASTLVNDVLMQIAKLAEGNYQSADYFPLP